MLAIFAAGFFTVVHYASVVYINSSTIERYVGPNSTNFLYALGSIISIFLLILAPFLIHKLGSKKAFLVFILLEIVATLSLGFSISPLLVAIFFILHHSGQSAINFFMDINVEQKIQKESETGRTRGALLTVQNVGWVLSPLLIPLLQNENSLKNIYIASTLVLVPLSLLVIFVFQNFSANLKTKDFEIYSKIKEVFKTRDTFKILVINFILNFFYSWMVIYLPLFLYKELGIEWQYIGIIFTVMLTPFLLFQFPTGILNDKFIGEKELLIIGTIIMSATTLILPLSAGKGLIFIALTLFLTRVGASIVEISTESYFFKKVKEKDTTMISLFRMVRPMSFLVAPLIAFPVIASFGYGASFYALGSIVLLALFFIPKVDTK